MIHSIYYLAFLKVYTHNTQQSPNTRASNTVSVFESIHKVYTQIQHLCKQKISTNNILNVVNRDRIVFNRTRIMLTNFLEGQNPTYLRTLIFVKKVVCT